MLFTTALLKIVLRIDKMINEAEGQNRIEKTHR